MASWTSTVEGRHLGARKNLDTEPELLLRKALHAAGARFRLHRQLAKGCTPDIVLPGRRLAIFVDGDYWHGCPVHGRRRPFTGPNAALWTEKMRRNRTRDNHSTALAKSLGWEVARVWECSIRANPAVVADAILSGASVPPVSR
jgi:DNA mismatch endonuclease (patch repair protein)